MRPGLTSALALLLAALPAAADPISLSDAVRLALDVSPDLEGAEAGVEAAGGRISEENCVDAFL